LKVIQKSNVNAVVQDVGFPEGCIVVAGSERIRLHADVKLCLPKFLDLILEHFFRSM